jgi:hypothetical protein
MSELLSLLLRPPPRRALVLLLAFTISSSFSQGTTEHRPGKVYLIRVSPCSMDRDSLMHNYLPELITKLDRTGTMTAHIKTNLYLLKTVVEGCSLIGYFDLHRQSKEELMQDTDLLVWLLHGHHVQIMPVEGTESPAYALDPASLPKGGHIGTDPLGEEK